jgi:hypothetical protein
MSSLDLGVWAFAGRTPRRFAGARLIWLEAEMTVYSVKLVDHIDGRGLLGVMFVDSRHAKKNDAIRASIERVMGLAFTGTSDSVSVSWGTGSNSDNLVLHFVEDIAHSYLRKKWPKMKAPDPNAGGHTHSSGSLSGTELYRTRPGGPLHAHRYGALAFHEALHNLFPYVKDQHTGGDAFARHFGGGIAAAHIPDQDPNEENKAFLRQGFSVRNPQLL